MSKQDLKHGDLTERLIQIYFEIYNELGYGFIENIYEQAFVLLLTQKGIPFQQQHSLDVRFRGSLLGEFRADLIVDSAVIVELKAAQNLDIAHERQLLNYLKATNLEVGLLFNFGPRAQFRRLIFENDRKAKGKAAGQANA